MADNARLICAGGEVRERSQGIRFDLPELGDGVSGFVVRFNHKPYAFINRCAHVPVELDWQHGEFFDLSRQYLVCATHGAHYLPETGQCVMGPCRGRALEPLVVVERDDNIYLILKE